MSSPLFSTALGFRVRAADVKCIVSCARAPSPSARFQPSFAFRAPTLRQFLSAKSRHRAVVTSVIHVRHSSPLFLVRTSYFPCTEQPFFLKVLISIQPLLLDICRIYLLSTTTETTPVQYFHHTKQYPYFHAFPVAKLTPAASQAPDKLQLLNRPSHHLLAAVHTHLPHRGFSTYPPAPCHRAAAGSPALPSGHTLLS